MSLFQTLVTIGVTAACGATAGIAITQLTVFILVSVLAPLTWRDQQSLEGLTEIGLIAGFVIGAAYATAKSHNVPLWLRKLIGGIAVWIGSTLLFVPLLGSIIILGYSLVNGGLPSHKGSMSAAGLVSMLATLPFGIILLRFGWTLCKLPNFRELRSGFAQGIRAVLLPREGKEFEFVTFECCLSRVEFEQRLEKLTVPRGLRAHVKAGLSWWAGSTIIARHSSKGFYILHAGKGPYVWILAPSVSISGSRVEASSKLVWPLKFFFYYWFGFLTIATPMMLIEIMAAAGDSKNTVRLFSFLFLLPFWMCGLGMVRLYQFLGRKQELQLIDWLCQNFSMRILRRDTLPKPLLF